MQNNFEMPIMLNFFNFLDMKKYFLSDVFPKHEVRCISYPQFSFVEFILKGQITYFIYKYIQCKMCKIEKSLNKNQVKLGRCLNWDVNTDPFCYVNFQGILPYFKQHSGFYFTKPEESPGTVSIVFFKKRRQFGYTKKQILNYWYVYFIRLNIYILSFISVKISHWVLGIFTCLS